ncbi:GH92 family glycosyl hydrolase [Streptomyces lincolnensis]|uniref:GH92 family glycosyl hydrolase n=1 Tax=Streptomyces lincolnensis TaxID=1915 RepID=UPI001E509AFA|nr:GH92 family glycosyl hydrolase [Streptomyces lincolnensis]MCD7443724.1 GH92 family glycosyl hydrolase [Streptomyces lincolnensis]
MSVSRPRAGRLLGAALALGATLCASVPAQAVTEPPTARTTADLARYVNPFVGTKPGGPDFGTGGGAGNTFPGAVAPFGMVQWSPDTDRSQPGGYFYDDDKIRGFSLTHLSGAGCYGAQDLPFMPYSGQVTASPATDPDHYLDGFSHDDEKASPGSYGVTLASGTKVELAATQRSGAGRFTYPESDRTASLLVNVSGSIGGANDAQADISEDRRTISGYVASGKFCGGINRYRVYFSATFDRPFASVGTWHNDTVTPGDESVRGTARAKVDMDTADKTEQVEETENAENAEKSEQGEKSEKVENRSVSVSGPGSGAYVTFDTAKGRSVGVKVGLSYVSAEGAAANARAEQGSAGFDTVAARARAAWNERLNQIAVEGGTDAQRTTFYTALYHSLIQPNVFSDVDGRYVGFDGRTHRTTAGHTQYANFSGWDIYRSEVQLLALLAPDVAGDIAQSMYNQAHQAGDVWDRWSVNNDFNGVMNGDPYHSILASVYAFGATGFDAEDALASMVKGATTVQKPNARYVERYGLADYQKLGYLPSDPSTTLEYTTADFGIAQLAGRLGDTSTRTAFMKRAQNWQNLFNPANDSLQPRLRDGSFLTPYDPADSSWWMEGNGAQYQWMVPYDLAGLFGAVGGDRAAVKRLDTYFTKLNAGPHEPYAFLGNEPSLNAPYAYAYAGAPYRTQDVVRRSLNTLYGPGPDGLVGNDDLGTMSAWYVWGALGMFPQVPGRAELVLASPLFPRITVHRDNGRTITVNAPGASADTYYVQSLKVNGRASGRAWLPESFVADGGTLDYTLGTGANTSWGGAAGDAPPSFREGEQPYFTGVTPSRVRVRPGDTSEKVTVGVRSLRERGSTLRWAAAPPEGLTVTPAGGEVAVPGVGGGDGAASFTVTAADGSDGFRTVPLTLTDSSGAVVAKASVAVTVAPRGSVPWYLDNHGISADDSAPTGDFDGGGGSYSAKALADQKVTPGAPVDAGGFSFTWPKVGPGDPDNIVVGGGGQVLDVSGEATRIALLGSSSNGPSTGTLTLTYTDGSTQQVTVGFSDWTLGGGAQKPSYGNVVAVRTAYRLYSGSTDDVDTYVFATAPVPLAAGKRLASVTLPSSTSGGRMHVFGLATA